LFDTLDTEFTNDEDFTPQGSYRWTPYRYWKKIKDIGKVLVSTSSYSVPGVIALVEVENYEVLEDILTNSPLRKFQYAIVHEDSPDERGIDVALLFDTDQFSYNSHEVIEVEFPFDKDDKTRDMLVVNGAIADDCYTIVVCHWPSRRGGQAISEGKRIHAAKELEQYLIREYREECRLLVLGDFNDDNQSASIQYLIQTEFDLRDAFLQIEMQGNGSYKYQNQWNMLDHIFISEEVNLLNAELFSPDFLQTEDVNYPGWALFTKEDIVTTIPY